LAVLPFVLYWQAAIGLKAFQGGDILSGYFPFQSELSHALARGSLPLWTPGLQEGYPLFAENEVAALYPLNLIIYRFLPTYLAVTYSVLFHLAWASVGMYLFCRATGLSVVTAALGGLVFGVGGFMTTHMQHLPLLGVAAWLPWLLLFQEKYWQARLQNGKTKVWFALMGSTIGLQLLGGFPQIAILSVEAFGFLGIVQPFFWPSARSSMRERVGNVVRWLPKTVGVVLAALVLGIGIAAVQLLPSIELLGFSVRDRFLDWKVFTIDSLEPQALTQLLAPYWFLGEPAYAANMEYWGYVGILPILFAFAAIGLSRTRRVGVYAIFGVLALSFALGGFNPLYQLLYYVPMLNRFRVPARFLLLFTFAAAYLSAVGFEALAKQLVQQHETSAYQPDAEMAENTRWNHGCAPHFPGTARQGRCHVDALLGSNRFLKLQLGAISLFFVGILASIFLVPPDTWSGIRYTATGLLLVVGVGLLAGVRLRRITRTTFVGIALGLTLFDLALFAMSALSSLNWIGPPGDLVQPPRSVSMMDDTQKLYRVFTEDSVIATGAGIRAALAPNVSLVYGKQAVTVYAPLPLRKNVEYIQQMSPQMLNLMNVRYYIQSLDKMPGEDTGSDPKQVFDLFGQQWNLPPIRAEQVEVISYADHTQDLPEGFLAGEITLFSSDAPPLILPIRLGVDTADWAILGTNSANRSQPAEKIPFPAYLSSIGHTFDGLKYIARYDLGSRNIVGIAATTFLPKGDLTIERVMLVDEKGASTSLASLLHQNDLVLVFRSHLVKIWENPNVMPRAFVVHQAENVSDEQTLVRLQDPDFRPDQVVLLSDGKPSGQADGLSRDKVVITLYEPERVSVQVEANQAGYLVLADSWYPGWIASVDGQSSPIYRADYIFRAVALPPGQHAVVFEYRPMTFLWGALITLSSLVLAGILAIAG